MQHAHAVWRDQVAKATLLPPFRVLLADGLVLGALRDRAFSLFWMRSSLRPRPLPSSDE